MKLILIRHAKSGWDDPTIDDHKRVLTERGEKSTRAIGQWLMEQGHVPDRILCSDATRTQQTAGGLMAILSPAPLMSLHPKLYHASPDTIADLIAAHPAQTLAVIGHNPGIGLLARDLLAEPPDHPQFDTYPTCATTVMQIGAQIAAKRGNLTDFIVPRDLF